jgi:hypothetical protein
MPWNRSVVLVSFGALFASAAPVRAQSLADVARKEEARRKGVAEPAKVYTNKDLKPTPRPAAAPDASTPDAKADEKASDKDAKSGEKSAADKNAPDNKAAASDKSAPAAAEPVKDQAYWAARLKAAQEQLARDETYGAAMQTRINSLTTDFINRDDPAQKRTLEQDRIKAIAELDRLKQAIAADKKALDSLLEEARRAGVPPGWLR